MRPLRVPISSRVRAALIDSANSHQRDPFREAAFLLTDALKRRGYLHEPDSASGEST
jgi:hypothetical protein